MKWLDFVAQMEQGMRASHAERALTSEGCSMTNLALFLVDATKPFTSPAKFE